MTAMATEVFRFTDLPPEIRDRIYQIILCTWPPPKLIYDEKRQLAVVPDQMAYIYHKVDIGILLANRRISRDAMDVLMKGNLFVRIVFRGVDVHSVMMPKQVPIVADGESVVTAFKGHIMSHLIEMPESQVFPRRYMMILRRDLDLFCQALAGGGITNFGKHSKHCVTIHNLFARTSTHNYLDLKNQERLLQPYRKHLRGFTSFKVVGNVKPSLAAAVAQEVKQEPLQDPQDLLRDMLQHKEVGKKYFDEGDSNMASETWSKALIKLIRLVRSDSWSRMKAESADDWSNSITEIFFQLNSNLTANTLRRMRETERTDIELAGQYAGSLYNAAQDASTASQMFNTNWRPTPEQEAKLCYRLASAHRIARDNIDVAEHCINLAARQFPNDSAIQQEKEKIARWKARGI
ncbi:hypothetical protein HD806DRAFT_494284 [Xylariaceae sp. AK1471]|nr:hypothetical protein HD806DRAFT_494284 [Xylariaceae sp. AK1471]